MKLLLFVLLLSAAANAQLCGAMRGIAQRSRAPRCVLSRGIVALRRDAKRSGAKRNF